MHIYEMDSSETISSKQIPMALPMWKMFYNPIITLFENLSNSATDMESLISSILNSTSEFSDIFVPRLDINVSNECIEVLENKYYIFTLWLQGRLFYILGYNKLSRIHNMSIEAQLKILGVLKMYQPHNYKKICKEYLNALKYIVFNVYNYTNMDFANTDTSKIILKQFFCEENVGENLDLHSIHITITTSETCKSLVIYLIRICSQIMLNEVDMKSRNITLQEICSCFIIILEKCEINLKLTVISAYSEFLQNTGLDYINNSNYKHFQLKNFYSCLELLLCQYKIFPNTYQEVDSLNCVLTEHFNTLCYYNGLNNFNLNVKLLRICQIVIFECEDFIKTIPSSESINTFSEDLKKSSCHLVKIILEKHPETIKLIECYLINIDKYKSFLNLLKLAEYMVKNEVVTYIEHLKEISENKSILISDVSSTYKKMYEKIEICLNIDMMELNMIEKQCQLIEQLLNSIYLINEEIKSWLNHKEKKINVTLKYFHSVEKFIFHMLKIFEHCCTNNVEINEITTSILNIFIYLLSIEEFSKNAEYLQTVIAVPLIPFIKFFSDSYCDIEISSTSKIFYFKFIKYDFNVTIQRRCLKVLSKAISHCTSSSDVHKKIKECVYCIFKNTIDLPDYQLKNEVLLSLPYAIIYELSTPYNIITEILHLAFNSGDPVLHKTLAKVLGTIACILGGHYIIYNYPCFIDILEYRSEIICYNCDSVSSIKNHKTYTLKNKNIEINRANFIKKNNYFEIMEDILIPFMKLLESTNVHVRKEMISVLPKLSTHMIRFHSVDITEKWVKCINDEEYIVRKEISVVVSTLLKNLQNTKDIDSVLKDHIYQLLIKEVISISQQSLENQNWKLQDTVLETVNIIGLANIQSSVLISFKLLVYFLMNINSSVARIASIYLNKIASSLSMTENELYTEYKKDICKAIIEVAIINFISFKFEFTSSLQLISKAIGFSGTKEFLNNDCHHLLPYLIPWLIKVPKTISLLNDISTLMGIEIPDLLGKQFSNIYPYVRLYEKDDISDKIMIFIEKYSKMSISSLKKRHFRVIHNELLLHYHLNSVKVMEELRSLSREEPENCDVTLVNSVQVANFLQPRFLGVLVYFDSKLMSRKVALSVKRKALQSLPEIIKLMGSNHITPLRFKVLATLRTTLTLNNGIFPQLSCNAWNAFIKNCDIESLGPLLSTIFVSLLPLLMTFPDLINDIFNYLIIKNENILREYISDLFFLLDTDVSDDIKVIVKKHMTKYEHRNCKENIMFFIKYISHENVEVRTYGVKFLQKVLENNKAELDNFILGSNGLDPLIVDLLDLLVEGCRDNDESLKLACSDCIGELGAIEPSHLPRRYIQTNQSFTFSIFEDSFVINALNELIRAFQSEKHSQNMDCFALAIQEILKTYDISPESNSENGKNLWESFPDNQREIMQPLLSSRYTISPHGEQVMNIHPIFGSSNIMSFTNWINSWTNRLIQLVQSEQTRLLFQYCRPSLKRDLRSLMFFLPHILVHTLLECRPNDRILIYEEMMAVLNNNQIKKKISSSVLEYRPLKSDFLIYVPENSNVEDQMKPTKIIYMLLDYLLRWSCEWQYTNCAGKSPSNEQNYLAIHNFLSQFCKLTLAQRNYNCNEFPRAILYLENYVNENPEEFKNQLGFFARIYAELDDPDGVAGIRAIQQTEPSLEELILAHEISGQVQDAAACYERLAQKKHLKPHILQGMIRCYLDLDNPSTACHIAEGLMCSQPEYSVFLLESQAEPLWRLNQFDKLAHLLNQPELKTNRSWGVQIGRCLLHFQNGEHDLFCHEWFLTRKDIVNQLSAATLEEGAYQHGYPQIIKLHILNELKKAEHIVYRVKKSSNNLELCESIVNNLVNEWQLRSRLVQSSVRVLEPILSLRRIVLQQAKDLIPTHMSRIKQLIDLHIGKCWLESASIARKVCMHQQAYIYLLNAEQYKLKELFIEKAKLHWKRGNQEVAFNTLKRGLEEYFPDASTFKTFKSSERKIDRKLCAEAKLLIASYNEETVNLDMETNLQKYREATEVYKEWEISMVHLAQYYDKVLNTLGDDRDIGLGGDVQIHMINYFGKSLQYGCQYIYQSMPRMLSIWLDYGTRVLESKEMENYNTKYENLLKMTKLINSYLERLPSYMFLSAFSQIVSRICHPQREVYLQLKSIIVTLILKYPQQTLWMIMSVYKSSYPVRTKRCQEILQDQRLKNAVGMTTLIHDFNRLAEKLIELCNKGIGEGVHTTSVSSLVKPLPRLLASKEFSKIMMPVQKFMKIFLPSTDISLSDHNPFPNNMAYIMGIDDTVHVLPSLQRPRRITLKGSDGKKYIHMLKPKDDLRKDFRLMEFNDVVNQYLHKEAESRQRRLLIRTYSVIPLNEECGLIEWIPNLVGLRPILINIYKQKGLYMSSKELRKFLCIVKDPLEKKRQVYTEHLLPNHPPVLSEWFRHKFPDPYSWYQARTAYIRTTAVMSMVGYILGLGDRHGENILFDSTNGDTVHVDFNCLFNKGETFEWPERVPFRLTPNMVKAMGPLEVEGAFRKSCEITLRVLRMQKDILMSIVKPFVYDPLVSWPRNQPLRSEIIAERTNEQALDHVKNIETRLQGMKTGRKLPLCLSVEGHVNSLIMDATNIDNLCQMYIGWGPYL